MIVLETERLILRHFTVEDAAFVLRLLNEPSFLENIGDKKVRTLSDAATYLLDGPIKSYQAHGHGAYLVALKESLEPMGLCGLLKRDQFEDPDVGYAFLPEFWSKGYALEAAAAVMEYGRRTLGLPKIIALVKPGNSGSIRVLEKLGLAFSKLIRMEPDGIEAALYE
jgi:RimJ/RimL family protein N-acetyltransferase